MNTKKDGGMAFPRVSFDDPRGDSIWQEDGMSLRDYFAAKAMVFFISREGTTFPKDALDSYDIADEMLKAREVK